MSVPPGAKEWWRGPRIGRGALARLAAVFVGLVLLVGSAHGGFFTVEVPVDNRGDAAREAGLERGLSVIIGRMTGVHEGLDEHAAGELLSDADRFLAGFRYVRTDEGLALEARFDGGALREALGEIGVAVWDARRPPILTWLAVDEQGARRMVERQEAAADPVHEAVVTGADERFLPLMFPLMDLEDRSWIGFREIWAGFEESIEQASGRYGSGPVLAVALRKSRTGGWRGRWHILVGGGRHEYRAGPGPLEQVVDAGLNWSSTRLAERYAVVPGEHEGRSLEIGVVGVPDLATLQKVLDYLRSINGVADADVYRASGRDVGIRLQIERDPDRVAEALDSAESLVAEALPSLQGGGGVTGGVARAYRWLPH